MRLRRGSEHTSRLGGDLVVGADGRLLDAVRSPTSGDLVVGADGRLLDAVRSPDDLLVNTVRRVECRRWTRGRLVLVGEDVVARAFAPARVRTASLR